MKTLVLLASVALAQFVGAPAEAGVVYRMQQSTGAKKPADGDLSEMKIEGLKLRMDQTSGKERTTMIFDGDADQMYVVDHRKKSYMIFDEELIERLVGQMSEAMKQMEKALEAVPAGQREMVEKMMKKQLGALAEAQPLEEPVIEDLGRGETVAEIDCDWKEIKRGDRTQMKGCFADWDDVPGGDAVLAVTNEMKSFMESLFDALTSAPGFGDLMSSMMQTPMDDMTIVGGFPLVSETYVKGTLAITSRFLEASESSLSAGDFRPPSDYKQQDLAGQSGGKKR